jgi:hypothetical protein
MSIHAPKHQPAIDFCDTTDMQSFLGAITSIRSNSSSSSIDPLILVDSGRTIRGIRKHVTSECKAVVAASIAAGAF